MWRQQSSASRGFALGTGGLGIADRGRAFLSRFKKEKSPEKKAFEEQIARMGDGLTEAERSAAKCPLEGLVVESCIVEIATSMGWTPATFVDNVGPILEGGCWRACIAGLQCNTSYDVRIRGLCEKGARETQSGRAYFRTCFTTAAPDPLVCRHRHADHLSLQWKVEDPDDAPVTQCEVQVAGAFGWSDAMCVAKPERSVKNQWLATVAGLSGNTSYTLRVRGCNAAGVGEWGILEASTSELPAVADLRCSLKCPERLSLEWCSTDPEGARTMSCEIEVSGTLSYQAPKVVQAPRRLRGDVWQVTAMELVGNSTYTFRVRGCNAAGAGPWVHGQFTTSEPPIQPTAFRCCRFPNKLFFEFNVDDPAGAEVLSCDVQVSSGFSWVDALFANGVNPHRVQENRWQATIAELAGDTAYNVRIRGRNAIGGGEWMTQECRTSSKPGKPTYLQCSERGPDKLSLTWLLSPTEGAAMQDCEIEVRGSLSWAPAQLDTPPFKLGNTDARWGATLTGLSSGTSHRIRVRGRNQAGDGEWLRQEFSTSDAPETPHALRCVSWRSPETMWLEWNVEDPEGAAVTKCDVLVRIGEASWNEAVLSDPMAKEGTSWRATITALSEDSLFAVRIRAGNAVGWSGWSTPWTQSVPGRPFGWSLQQDKLGWVAMWQVEDPGAAPVTSCVLNVTQQDNESATTLTTWNEPSRVQDTLWQAHISGMAPEEKYRFCLHGCSIAGEGLQYQENFQVSGKLAAPIKLACVCKLRRQLRLEWTFAVDDETSAPSTKASQLASSTQGASASSPASKKVNADIMRCELQQYISGSWQAAALNGGCTAIKSKSGCWCAKMDGLSPGTAYDLRVRGHNAVGEGEWLAGQFWTSH